MGEEGQTNLTTPNGRVGGTDYTMDFVFQRGAGSRLRSTGMVIVHNQEKASMEGRFDQAKERR